MHKVLHQRTLNQSNFKIPLEYMISGILHLSVQRPLAIESIEVGLNLPLYTRSKVLSLKYDMDAHMTTLFGGEAHTLC